MPSPAWNRPSARRCTCGHDKTLHAYPERRAMGLGACKVEGCACARFITPGQRRYSEWQKRHAEMIREARERARELNAEEARIASQEGRDAV